MAQLKLGTTIAGNTAWHSGNDGTGSGLDADLLDGLDSLHYLNYNNLTNKPTVWPIAGTDGQLVYISGGVATSSPLVFYDNVNQRLGIGTSSPTARLELAETWNNVATTFTHIKSNVTDTASAAGSLLMDLQVGNNSFFSVRKDGRILAGRDAAGNILQFSPAERALILTAGGINSGGMRHITGSSITLLSGSAYSTTHAADAVLNGALGLVGWHGNTYSFQSLTPDLALRRDAANTLAQYNSTNPQTSRIYNTFTDTSNYERAKIGWNTNVLEIGTENAGTGTLRNINLIGGNVGIGTTAPAAKLSIAATATDPTGLENSSAFSINSSATPKFQFGVGTATIGYAAWIQNSVGDTTYPLLLQPRGGNVSIGTSTSLATLDVASNAGRLRITQKVDGNVFNGIDFVAHSGGVNGGLIWNQNTGEVRLNAVASYFPTFYSSGVEIIRINTAGNVGIGTASPSAKLDVAGDIEVNSNVNLNSEATTLATVTKTQVASFPVASFRSGKLIVQAYDSVTGEVQISELLVAHNGTTASATEYGVVFTGTSSMVIYDVDISAGNVRLLAVRTTANSTQYKISETLMVA